MLSPFPKIFALGTNYIKDIFNHPVEVSEKLDASQLVVGKINGQLHMRSKGATLYLDNPNKMFMEGISYFSANEHLLPDNMVFYMEYFQKPKHNVLAYDKIPKNHCALFGVRDLTDKFYDNIEEWADKLNIDHVPIIYRGKIESPEQIYELIERKSYLGGADVEGVVVKNYHNPFLLGGQPIGVMAGKYVSEAFKEVHRSNWNKENKSKGRWEAFMDEFKTEARWEKAVQYMRDCNELENDPKDIGKLLKRIHQDIEEEEKEYIKEFLFQHFGKDLKRNSTIGFPEWYKKKLLGYSEF